MTGDSEDSTDKTVVELRDLFGKLQIPIVVIYQKQLPNGMIATYSRYSADVDQLVTMATTGVSALIQRLQFNFKLDDKGAKEMAMKAIEDSLKTGHSFEQIIEDD